MTTSTSRHHLYAFAIAAGLISACAITAVLQCARAEMKFIRGFADEPGDLNLQGVALQKAAVTQPDLLVLYGSSELVRPTANRAAEFFKKYPTGFRVFPVGKAGASSLATMEKIAAVGRFLKGRKVTFSISPSYFLTEEVNRDYYEGNFSALQARELAFSRHLSAEFKRDAARRLIQYPGTLEGHWTLEFGLRRLAGDTILDRIGYYAIWPLGRFSNLVGRAQDHIEAGLQIAAQSADGNPMPDKFPGLNWKEVFRKTSVKAKTTVPPLARRLVKRPKGSMDVAFLKKLHDADEWDDFELLLRGLKEMEAQPLFLSMPLHGVDLETSGVSAKARKAYGEQLRETVAKFGMPVVYFEQFDQDPTFFSDTLDHPGERGWVFFNKILDDFYHDRPLPSPVPGTK